MTSYSTRQLVRSVRSAVFCSLVTAPSTALFICFVMLSFNNSIAGEFLSAARTLVAGAPDGKVNVTVCLPSSSIYQVMPRQSDEKVSEPLQSSTPLPVLCKEEIISVDDTQWRKDVDHNIRQAYFVSALIGLTIWLFLNNLPNIHILRRLCDIKNNMLKHNRKQ
ncbi:hypothetical protein LWJ10_003966 [Salmonella enterica]|nr:hypothetical protein [Salmonella enterica]